MKKIDYLVLRNFIGPFILTFLITLFIFLMQFLWKYIDDLIGKGLEISIIFKLIFFASASFVPLVLPLAVLLSSIMTYGNLGEHYELVAMKASGVSLLRFMRALLITSILISIGGFLFSNHVLPQANLKFGALLSDIRNQKPALNIKEGVFYNGIEGFSIRVGKKGEDGQSINDIIIYDHTSGKGNDNVLVAESGVMFMSADERYLILKMFNGRRYVENRPMGGPGEGQYEHYTTTFGEWEKWFDLSEFDFEQQDESFWSDHYKMMNLSQLSASIDSIQVDITNRQDEFERNIKPYFTFKQVSTDTLNKEGVPDSIYTLMKTALNKQVDKEQELRLLDRALGEARNVKSFAGVASRYYDYRSKSIRKHQIEYQRKFTLAFACFVMFLIGAPFGAIIRMGGFGAPLFVSVVLFVIFHVLSMIGENVAEEGTWNVYLGMWLATMVLFPGGVVLSIKAMNDSPLFTLDWFYALQRKLKRKKIEQHIEG